MPVKRSRVGRSSSNLELEAPVSTAPASYVPQAKFMKDDKTGEPSPASRPIILSVASPVRVGEPDQPIFGGFLEQCHYCKRRMAPNSEVFMYSNLCAFCSVECRDFQIALDQLAERQSQDTKEIAVQGQGIHNLKDWFGS